VNEVFLRLDDLRRKEGITLTKMGEMCGVKPSGVQTWKKAKTFPAEHLLTLATHFNVTVDWLLGRGDMPVTIKPESPSATISAPPLQPACIYPTDCDLPGQVAEIRGELADIRKLLISLLAEERSKNAAAAVAAGKKAG